MSNNSMEHIDPNLLHTDLMYRFQYVCKFVGFGPSDIQTLKNSSSLIVPLVPKIVESVYHKLFSFDITKAYFLQRNQNFTGKLESSLDQLKQDSEQIRFRKDMLSKYLVKLVTAEYDENFVKYLDWVGKIHTSMGGRKSLNVDFVHCNALMGYVEDLLIKAICEMKLEKTQEVNLIRAFNKLLWVQMDLFARHYINADKAAGKDNHTVKTETVPQRDYLSVGAAAAAGAICTMVALKFWNQSQ